MTIVSSKQGITPGPWRTGDLFHTVFGPPNGNPAPETIASVRSKANAIAIAAVPNMLAKLRELYTYLVNVADYVDDIDILRQDALRKAAEITEVLEKAGQL